MHFHLYVNAVKSCIVPVMKNTHWDQLSYPKISTFIHSLPIGSNIGKSTIYKYSFKNHTSRWDKMKIYKKI